MRFDGKQAGVDAMLRAPWMVEGMAAAANRAKAEAERIAPVDTGRYKASFKVTSGLRAGRAYARLSNDATSPQGYPYCQALEFGNSRIRAQHIIQRSLDAIRG